MGLVADLENKVREYLSGDYEVTETLVIPTVDNVPFGKKAKKMNLCAYCIDLRKSSELLTVHQKQTSGKIHKAFLAVASRVVSEFGGEIRSFGGDSLLAFWPAATKGQVSNAVKAALSTKWMLNIRLSKHFEKYSKLDFGVGVDWGEVYIVRAGIPRQANKNDLVFIGDCVNLATAIANQAEGPYHVEISESTYSNLTEELLYGTKNNKKVNMWKDSSVVWKKKKFASKATTWYWHF